MIANRRKWQVTILTCLLILAGCASTGSSSAAYSSFLVLGVTEDYSNRAYYEREVAAELRARGVAATPYYEAAGGDTPSDRDSVRALVEGGDYDAVLVSRLLDQSADIQEEHGSVANKVTRRDGKPLDFFRYDYEELDEPASFSIKTSVTLSGELYDAASEQQVWTTEFKSAGAENVGELIEATAAGIVRRLARDGFIVR